MDSRRLPVSRCDVGDEIAADNAGWSFAGEVPARFDAHVRRSVPFYDEGHGLVAELSDWFVGEGSVIYDLGCATGRLSRLLAERHQSKRPRVLAVDADAGMLERTRDTCAGVAGVETIPADITGLELVSCDLVVAYYTLQFVPLRRRRQVLDRIHAALHPGGALVLFEKVRAPDARFQDIATGLYTELKLRRGFSGAEIVNKARSLKGVLQPCSTEGNLELLARAGFTDVMTVFKYVCFEGFVAIRD
jgi:tRNA (cmo5U34)-methyltransferase